VNDDVEIAWWATGRAMFPFAVQPKPLSGRYAGWNLDGQLTVAPDATGAATGRTRLGDRLPRAAAIAARPGDG
jgi:hypothetical protein